MDPRDTVIACRACMKMKDEEIMYFLFDERRLAEKFNDCILLDVNIS